MTDNQPLQKRILILLCAETEYGYELNTRFVKNLNKRLGPEIKLEWHHFNEVGLRFDKGVIRAFIIGGEPLDVFDFVYFKSLFRYYEQAAAIAEYLDEAGIPFVSSELRQYMVLTKLTQYARLARANLPIAPSIFISGTKLSTAYNQIIANVGSPFVFKAINGSLGNINYLVNDHSKFRFILQQHPEEQFIAQTYIPNSHDLRVLIVNKAIKLVIERRRINDTSHLNNTTQGAKATLLRIENLSPETQAMALKAAKIMKREVAGVDLIFNSLTGEPYILEVNASPQIASGAFVEEKLEIYSNYFKNVLKLPNLD